MDQRIQVMARPADGAGERSRHFYPTAAMIGDYLRAAAGLVPAAVMYATVPFGAAGTVAIGGFAAIFAIFGLRTVVRHGTSLEMTETELRATGLQRRTIAWAELDRLKLAYFSTRRDRKSGWMQLELGAGGTKVGLDSRIDGFDLLVRRAAAAAAERRLDLSDATLANLRSLGLDPPDLRGGR